MKLVNAVFHICEIVQVHVRLVMVESLIFTRQSNLDRCHWNVIYTDPITFNYRYCLQKKFASYKITSTI